MTVSKPTVYNIKSSGKAKKKAKAKPKAKAKATAKKRGYARCCEGTKGCSRSAGYGKNPRVAGHHGSVGVVMEMVWKSP